MQQGIQRRPLIVIYGSYGDGTRGNCAEKLYEIVDVGRRDLKLDYIRKEVVANLDYAIDPPEDDSPEYGSWVRDCSQ